MKERYFIKHLATFLIPLILPLIILGSLSFYTTQRDMKDDINKNSKFLLIQSQRQMEMILDELETLKLALYQNAKVFNELSNVLQNPVFTYESSTAYQIIFSYLNALTSSKPYIHSIYFYAQNPNNRFVSSLGGLSTIDRFNDTQWYDEFMNYEGSATEWTTKRETRIFHFEKDKTELVTIYNVLAPKKIGIILNIRPKYIENVLANITTHKDQVLYVLNENNQIIFSNTEKSGLKDTEINRIANQPSTFFDFESSIGEVNVTKVESERYNWKYVSVIPHHSLYETPSRIMNYTIGFACLSFVLGLALTFYLTRRNYRQLLAITSLLRSAENNRIPLVSPKKVNDEYSYIVQNMIAHFIEHRYIQTQLSEKKYRLQFMELLALQSQINPHFLYNTLNSIYWETVGLTGKPNKASDMIENLSDMLSYSFSRPTNDVTWAEEIANTVSYVNIQKKRYKNMFDVIFEYDEDILGFYTMKLILQPLVENSIYHGIKEKETPGLIKIKIYRSGITLRLIVIDNGNGIETDRLAHIRHSLNEPEPKEPEEHSQHIGLLNTNKRLRLMYNSNYSLTIKSKQRLGTVICVVVPLHTR